MQLWITEVDSAGRPRTDAILLEGPAVVIDAPGDLATPEPVVYEFDPPFVLPRTGKFWFGIKEVWCDFIFGLLATASNPYSEGCAWRLQPTGSLCVGLGVSPDNYDGQLDLAFKIEFCDMAVPVQSGSWGRVKAVYR